VSFFSKIGKAVSGAVKAVSPILKPVAGTLAVVFPPVGVPLAAGIAISDKVVKALNSSDPPKREAAQRMVAATTQLAASGNVSARNGLTLLGKRAAALREARRWQVQPTGRLRRQA
jgi:hypothetical protein